MMRKLIKFFYDWEVAKKIDEARMIDTPIHFFLFIIFSVVGDSSLDVFTRVGMAHTGANVLAIVDFRQKNQL